MKTFFVIILLMSALSGFSQSKKVPDVFEEGYVVTLKGDTIRGYLKMPKTNEAELYQKMTFKDKANKQRLYTPGKITGYGFGGYHYMNGYHNSKQCFFKVLSQGRFNLLQICYEEMTGSEKKLIQEFCVMTGAQGEEFIVLEEKGLKKQLKDFFKTNKALVQKINEQKTIDYKSEILERYFNEFNEFAKSTN